MWQIVKNVFSPSQYMPHGHCYLWQTPLVWLHVVSDLLIALAYFSIPVMLIYFIYKRRDVPFMGIFALFGAFIILCGTGHLLDVWTLWHSAYWLSGIEKAITALISCYTAGQMVTLLPQFLSLKTPEQLEAINRKLQHEIGERQQAEQMLQSIVTGTASVTGEAFFPALVENLAKALEVRQAFVAELVSQSANKLNILAFWTEGKAENNYQCELADNFCEADIRPTKVCNCSHVVQSELSKAINSKKMETAYHLEVPLLNGQDRIGILSISHDFPLAREENALAIMTVFAVRASAELQRQKVELALRCAYDELEVRVRERTAKLAETNAIMQAEISERIAAESALRLSEAREREKARQLEVTLHQLKSTQAQIVHSEKMASLGQMVAGIAHEINNPVSFIYGNVTPAIEYSHYLLNAIDLYQQHYPQPPDAIKEQIEAVEFDFIKEDFIKLLESMKTGAERIKQIVLSLRNFSHLDEADRKPANLNQDIESTLMILQHRLKPQPRRCAIEVIREYGKLPLVECYPGQLNQVFMNLLSNAIDALEERLQREPNFTPQIRICTEVKNNLDKSNIKSAIVRIADNGAGIPEKVKQRIFDPFFTTKPIGKGTGLGLSISHQIIVEKHQGQLECHSQLGQGTEFLIELNFCAYIARG